MTAQPYFVLAPRFAATGLIQHVTRGADAISLVDGQAPVAGVDLADLTRRTAASWTRLGIGLSYSHEGTGRDGVLRMPVEASLAIERTVASGSGVVPAALTSRVMLRVYKRVK